MLILPQHYHHPWSQPLHRTQGLREAISSDAWSTTEWACSLHAWLTLLRTGDRPPQRENCPNFKVSPLRKRVCPMCVQPPCTHVHTRLKLMASTTFVNIHTRTRKSKECLRGVNWTYWWMIDWLWWCATLCSLFFSNFTDYLNFTLRSNILLAQQDLTDVWFCRATGESCYWIWVITQTNFTAL